MKLAVRTPSAQSSEAQAVVYGMVGRTRVRCEPHHLMPRLLPFCIALLYRGHRMPAIRVLVPLAIPVLAPLEAR